jgi:uncharacterized protein (DUF305 family)
MAAFGSRFADAQDVTPPAWTCDGAATPVTGAQPGAAHEMAMGTPEATAEIDRLYIDMMIPHHQSIIALSQAALPHLQDERLRALAQRVIEAQSAEIAELGGYREQWYGSAEPQPLDEHAMMQLAPGATKPMDEMMREMDAVGQVAEFCAAPDADLAFIELTIPHHASAVIASEAVLAQAVHPEMRDFAQRVIDAQQREIDELEAIRDELYGPATSEPAGS